MRLSRTRCNSTCSHETNNSAVVCRLCGNEGVLPVNDELTQIMFENLHSEIDRLRGELSESRNLSGKAAAFLAKYEATRTDKGETK